MIDSKRYISTISKVTVTSMDDDALSIVCQGVKVKKVSWGYDFDKVEPFYAYQSNFLEIKRWAFENVNQDPSKNLQKGILLKALKADLFKIRRD